MELVRDAEAASAEVKKCPEGHVERTLNFRDRNLIFGAVQAYCNDKSRSDYKYRLRIDKIAKLLNIEENIEYFDMLDEWINTKHREWLIVSGRYNAYHNFKAGQVFLEKVRESFPDFDPNVEPPKPGKKPKLTPEEMRGKARAFHIPSKIDAFIIDTIKAYDFKQADPEYVTELCVKYGLSDDL